MHRFLAPVLLATLAAPAIAADPESPVVRVTAGQVRGTVREGVSAWLGVPFAAPPTGDNRWHAPRPAIAWSGVRDASAYGHDCMQLPFPSDAAPLGTQPAEDCLVANVWAPAGARANGRLPVIVWIYGGGFVNGGSSPPTYSGAPLARKGAVVVSFNYRVGRFGTFAHPALAEPSGNFGYQDQFAALQWVKANVAAFGGDPGNVTIIGESAGGMSVNVMVTSPQAAGLFHRAVVMSGGDGRGMGMDRAAAEHASVAFAQGKGIAADDPQAAVKLRALPADQVVDGLNLATIFNPGAGPRTFASPYPDGIVARSPDTGYRSGAFARVPVMIGATSDDIGGRDGSMVNGARDLAGVIAGAGTPTYYYRFSYVAQSAENGKGAAHATDIPFFFNTQAVKYGNATTPRDQAMGDAISSYIVNFARTGDPNGAGLPRWQRYRGGGGTMMDFAASGRAVAGSDPWAPTSAAGAGPRPSGR